MKNLLKTLEVENVLSPSKDIFEWEKHCGACDWFGNEKRCPYYNLVKSNPDIYWKDMGCEYFWD